MIAKLDRVLVKKTPVSIDFGCLLSRTGRMATCYTNGITMAISKDLLDILVCPLCKATVELKQDQSGLKCVECKRVYPIRDDIPVMLVDEARVEA